MKPIASFIHLLQDTIRSLDPTREPNAATIELLEKFHKDRLLPLWERANRLSEKEYMLAFVGLTNVGKSTLMEALLGFPVAPQKNGPATAIPVKYRYAEKWNLRVRLKNTVRSETPYASAQELNEGLQKIVVCPTPQQIEDIDRVVVEGPMLSLKAGLILADTPGFGAAQEGENSTHQQQLEKFITEQKINDIYFCVASGDNWAVTPDEKKFYEKIAHRCSHVMITKWEGGEEDKKAYRDRYQRVFPSAAFVFVNAKRENLGKPGDHGISELKEIIETNSTPEKRETIFWKDILVIWKDLREDMEELLGNKNLPWNPISLANFRSTCKQ